MVARQGGARKEGPEGCFSPIWGKAKYKGIGMKSGVESWDRNHLSGPLYPLGCKRDGWEKTRKTKKRGSGGDALSFTCQRESL